MKSQKTIKKLTNAEEYSWAGVGTKGSSKAATYGVFEGGKLVAKICRAFGGGFMEKATWECRNLVPMSFVCPLTKASKVAKPGSLVMASGPTLKSVRSSLLK